jgi:hypothetical protein
MAKVQHTNNGYSFQCPGCGEIHEVSTATRKWAFSGTLEKPSFMPSVLVEIDFTDKARPKKICHSLVTDGRIRFLSDSTHKLACQEVELPDFSQ